MLEILAALRIFPGAKRLKDSVEFLVSEDTEDATEEVNVPEVTFASVCRGFPVPDFNKLVPDSSPEISTER